MLQHDRDDAGSRDSGADTSQITSRRSALLAVAGTVDRSGANADAADDTDAELDKAAGALRSWVVGWTHRLDPLGSRRATEPTPAGVRRLAEAVIDVLLERRPAEQVKRWVSREVFALLSTVAHRRTVTRFAARSMVRSIQLHAPGPDAVESTVLVQDGPRVRAVALRFERTGSAGGSGVSGSSNGSGGGQERLDQERFEWRCTALQFA